MTIGQADWRLTLFSLFFLGLFLSLGIWQTNRGQEKTELLAAMDINRNLPGEIMSENLDVSVGDPVRLFGQFDRDVVFLIDNRVLQGRVGFELLQLFHDQSGVDVLVNRGYVPAARTRAEVPALPAASNEPQAARGLAYLTEMTVPENNVARTTSPWIVQVAKPAQLENIVGAPLFDKVVRLEANHPDALPRYWPVTIMSPERHYGYAATWFLMALAVVIAFIYAVRRDAEDIGGNTSD